MLCNAFCELCSVGYSIWLLNLLLIHSAGTRLRFYVVILKIRDRLYGAGRVKGKGEWGSRPTVFSKSGRNSAVELLSPSKSAAVLPMPLVVGHYGADFSRVRSGRLPRSKLSRIAGHYSAGDNDQLSIQGIQYHGTSCLELSVSSY